MSDRRPRPSSATGRFLRRGGAVLAAGWLALLLLASGTARAAPPMEEWCRQADEVRILAENDAALARQRARELEAALPADAPAPDRARILNLLSRIEVHLGLVDEAAASAKAALDLATAHDDRVGQAEAHLNVALNAIFQADLDAVKTATLRSLELVDGLDREDLLAEALLRSSMMYRRLGQIDESITLSLQGMEIAKASTDPMVLAYAHHGLAIGYAQGNHYEDALQHWNWMVEQARRVPSLMLEAQALRGVGEGLAARGEMGAAEDALRRSVELFQAVGAPHYLSSSLYALADHYRKQGHQAQALPLFDDIVAIYERHPNKIGLWFTLSARSETHLQLGGLTQAEEDTERAYALAREIGLSLYLSESARRVAAVLDAKGEHARAYRLATEAAEMNAQAEREKLGARMLEVAGRYEAESKRREIAALTQRNEQQSAELRQRVLQQRFLWTVLGGSVFALLGTGFFLMRLRQSNQLIAATNAQLRSSENDVRLLNTELEARVQSRTAQLRQQTRYLRALIDALPWWVWLKDTESRYLAVNQTVADACGLPAEELEGKSSLEVQPAGLSDALCPDDDREVMRLRRSKTVEAAHGAGERTMWMETYKAPVFDEDGTVLGTVGFVRDISGRKAAEAAREAALAEAERLARLRGEFMAQMSHELRTPLNGILGYAQILRRDKTLGERQLAGVNVIQQSGEHLLTLINDILDFTRIEAGKLVLDPADIRFDRFLGLIAEMVHVKAEQKLLAFHCDLAPDLPRWVRADDKRLRQVLLNLLANAVKFTDRGEVRLSVTRPRTHRVRFEVRDTGVGIGPEHLDKIFEPFEQAGELRHRSGGAGLGLAISRELVHLMGGDIHAASTPGQGSVFSFEVDLPEMTVDAAPGPAEEVFTGYAGPRRTILVVDDVAGNRAVATDMLGQLGFEIHTANSAEEAIEAAHARRPDLILMDVVMPGIGGLEATRRLRRLPGLSDIPIIAVSASASGGDARQSFAAGVNAFLAKPLDLHELLERIAALLDIEWLRAPGAEAAPAPPPSLIAPPLGELEALHRVVLQGNMRDVMLQAERLAALDERYRPFAARLHKLAESYQSRALKRLVEEFLDETPT